MMFLQISWRVLVWVGTAILLVTTALVAGILGVGDA